MGPGPAAVGRGYAPSSSSSQPTNIDAIIARVTLPAFEPVPRGFTGNFELPSNNPIAIDDDGKVVESKETITPFLACVSCGDPLLVSAAYENDDDRVSGLQCGHLIDAKCLKQLSAPQTPDELARVIRGDMPVLGEDTPPSKKKRKGNSRKKAIPVADIYRWRCPVKGCGRMHVSEHVADDSDWKPSAHGGVIALYM